jgi:hypothetical protein
VPTVTTVRRHCVVRAYDSREWIHGGVLVDTREAAKAISTFLNDPVVAKVHVRNVEYGCFAYEAHRAPE